MGRTLTDWSALRNVEVSSGEKPKTEVLPPVADAGKEALDNFSKDEKGDGGDELEALKVALEDMAAEKAKAVEREETAEKNSAELQRKVDGLERELERLRGDNARLKGEAAKCAEATSVEEKPSVSVVDRPMQPVTGVLMAPKDFEEMFDGELREMVISALADALDAAKNGDRERRAVILEAVLAVNKSSGELERRRTELKQIFKDAGYYNDPKPLEKLGFKLISGRTHRKLEYAGNRMPMSKTPSDYRANLNTSADMANRCF